MADTILTLEDTKKAIELRYMEVGDVLGESLVADALYGIDDLKIKALSKLGIEPRNGETPMRAWTRAMCEENGFEHTTPLCRAVADAITRNIGARRFMFWLA